MADPISALTRLEIALDNGVITGAQASWGRYVADGKIVDAHTTGIDAGSNGEYLTTLQSVLGATLTASIQTVANKTVEAAALATDLEKQAADAAEAAKQAQADMDTADAAHAAELKAADDAHAAELAIAAQQAADALQAASDAHAAELKAAADASEGRFRSFTNAMPNHVWTSTPAGQLDWFNPQVYEYSGASQGELDGEGWARIVHPDDLPRAVYNWTRALTTGVFYESEFRLRRNDGIFRWFIARAIPIIGDGGVIVQWIGTNTDIDDQKRVTQALHESERRLVLSQTAAGIASLEVDIATGMVFGSEGFWNLWGLSPRHSVHISVLEQLVIPEDQGIRSNSATRKHGTAVADVQYRIRRADTGELR